MHAFHARSELAQTFGRGNAGMIGPLPVCVAIEGPLPIEFEHGYVTFEDLPDNLRRQPYEKHSGIFGMLGLDEDDENEDDALEEEGVIYDADE